MKKPRSYFRFGLSTLLFLIACAAGYFGGFEVGKDGGVRYHYLRTVSAHEYQVGDLVGSDDPEVNTLEATEELVNLILSTIDREQWEQNGSGGKHTITSLPSKQQPDFSARDPLLLISATGETHEQVQELLRQLRRMTDEVSSDEIIPPLQSANALKTPENYAVIRSYSQDWKPAKEKTSRNFTSAVDIISDLWGNPFYHGQCTQPGFPKWSPAYRIAIWPKNNGYSYVEVRDINAVVEGEQTVRRAVVAGWHPQG